ncbi:MAG: hypothetical protein C4521_12635 [Actinobacteria bacterium]|nr:MAG: hypothetical protein C4521_12635 [Actinomycetota bacterium]
MKHEPVDLSKVKTTRLDDRRNLVEAGQFGDMPAAGQSFAEWFESLPDVLAARSLRALVDAIVTAHEDERQVVFALGAHVIKCGLSPIVIDLMERNIVTCVALNGAGMVHDVEVALIGATSEDVGEGLIDGTFGMAAETGQLINTAARAAGEMEAGLGASVGAELLDAGASHADLSILASGVRLEVPVTVHVALGTDIVHMQPTMDGAATGAATMNDFKLLTAVVADLGDGGVFVNVGSAVLLPEIFLKCLTVARNLGNEVERFTTANFDFIQHYRPGANVVSRPTAGPGSRGYAITGHHEIMVPLLAQAVVEGLRRV